MSNDSSGIKWCSRLNAWCDDIEDDDFDVFFCDGQCDDDCDFCERVTVKENRL